MVYIVKRNGKKQKFSNSKIMKGCEYAGASKKVASAVASTVSKKVFEGMSARRIGELTIAALRTKDKKASIHFAKYFNKRWK